MEKNNNKDFSNMIDIFSKLYSFNKTSNETTNSKKNITEFDDYINTEQMKIIKSAIPFLDYNIQKKISILVKTAELKKTLDIYTKPNNENKLVHNSKTNDPYWKKNMLNSIKTNCSQDKKYIVDMMIKTLDIKDIMKTYSNYKSNLNYSQNIDNNHEQSEQNNNTNQDDSLNKKLNSMLTEDQQKILNSFNAMMNKGGNHNE